MCSAPVGDGAKRTRIECRSHANRRSRVQRGRSATRPSSAASNGSAPRSRSSTSHRGCGARPPTPTTTSRRSRRRSNLARSSAVLIHAVYLLNPATEDKEMRSKTLASLIQSLRVGAGIGAVGVVLHPGSAKTGDVPKAIKRAGKVIGKALDGDGRVRPAARGHRRRGRHARTVVPGARRPDRRVRQLEAARPLPRLVSPVRVRLRRRDPGGARSDPRRMRPARRPRAAPRAALQRLARRRLARIATATRSWERGCSASAGCANFVSDPRFERLPCVLETGSRRRIPRAGRRRGGEKAAEARSCDSFTKAKPRGARAPARVPLR